MSSSTEEALVAPAKDVNETTPLLATTTIEDEQIFQLPESRKMGVTGAVFLILNKMIGTGSTKPGLLLICRANFMTRPQIEHTLLMMWNTGWPNHHQSNVTLQSIRHAKLT
jgi:hypothetical protein